LAWQRALQPPTAMDETWMAIWQRSMLVAIWSPLVVKVALPSILPTILVLPMDELVDVLSDVLCSMDEAMVVIGR